MATGMVLGEGGDKYPLRAILIKKFPQNNTHDLVQLWHEQ